MNHHRRSVDPASLVRTTPDAAWPLKRADGRPFYEGAKPRAKPVSAPPVERRGWLARVLGRGR